jgi:organic hydroperoxide reductase OsmC/OhrA
VPSAENLTADVEGDIEDVDGVLKITKIRLHYHIKAPAEKRESIERLMGHYAEACPAYQSVKGCIDCSWTAEIEEG